MKHPTSPYFFNFFIIFLLIAALFYIVYNIETSRSIQSGVVSSLSTNRLVLNNYLTNQLIEISSKTPHLISVFVGITPTMQIKADSFSFKGGILTCYAVDRDFHIIGSMHSVVIEEIKAGQSPITLYLNKPPQTQEKQNETIIR